MHCDGAGQNSELGRNSNFCARLRNPGRTNLAAIRWVLTAQAKELHARLETIKGNGTDFSHVERELLRLKADLPIEYVRREDWIRFSNTLEAKVDALRAELRAEISGLRDLTYQRSHELEEETTI